MYMENSTITPVASGLGKVDRPICPNAALHNGSGYRTGVGCVVSPMHNNLTRPYLREMTFNDDNLVSVIAYGVLFVIAAVANLTVFITLFKNRHRKSRVNLFIMHLNMADLIVTFVMIPLEIGWHVTVAWKAGDGACRIMMFWRVFGFYLSSFILITISLDRYFAVLHPLSLNDADKRGKIMLAMAWLFSFVASVPQSVIFHVESHPFYPDFRQCVTFNFYPSPAHELAYNLFNITALYVAPLSVIVVAYSLILYEITKKSRESREEMDDTIETLKARGTFRRSGIGRIEKARIRTLKMTIVIVFVFVLCWTPYFVISAWWWIDRESAKKINMKIQRALFLFAVSNSCVNPIVYGMFTKTFLTEFKKHWRCRRSGYQKHSLPNMPPSSKIRDILAKLRLSTSSTNRTSFRTSSAQEACASRAVVCTTCAIALASDMHSPVVANFRIRRQLTPPPVAEGNSSNKHLEKYV